MSEQRHHRFDLVQGTLDLLLLKITALEPQHGWAISQRLRQVSNDAVQASDGSVYPALQKLELAGWIRSEWRVSELGRRAKFYSLTPPGRRRLTHEAEEWQRLSSVSRVLRLKDGVASLVLRPPGAAARRSRPEARRRGPRR